VFITVQFFCNALANVICCSTGSRQHLPTAAELRCLVSPHTRSRQIYKCSLDHRAQHVNTLLQPFATNSNNGTSSNAAKSRHTHTHTHPCTHTVTPWAHSASLHSRQPVAASRMPCHPHPQRSRRPAAAHGGTRRHTSCHDTPPTPTAIPATHSDPGDPRRHTRRHTAAHSMPCHTALAPQRSRRPSAAHGRQLAATHGDEPTTPTLANSWPTAGISWHKHVPRHARARYQRGPSSSAPVQTH
jgi:hypothetical protein